MKKLVSLISLVPLLALAQEVVTPIATATPGVPSVAIPLPEAWSSNAIIVLCVNFVLAIVALLSKKIPGNLGKIVQGIVDLFSANPKH